MIKRSMSMICLLALLTLPLLGQTPDKKMYSCSSSSARTGTARIGSGSGVRTMGTIEMDTEKTLRFLPCDVPDGINMPRYQGNVRAGFEAVLAAVNKEVKKKKQLTLRVDPSLEEGLAAFKAEYGAGGYRVEDLLNNLCGGGRCEWQFEEQGESRLLAITPLASTAAP
jgi:hypothetical protein